MSMSKLSILFICLIISVTVVANDAILGVWACNSGKAQVEIYRVRDKYYGRVIGLTNAIDATGSIKLDRKNPDKTLQGQPIVGLVVLRDLVYSSDDNQWTGGRIYNPDDGKSYKCEIKLKDNNTMDVRGYIGIACFGKTQTMHRIK